MTNWVDPYLAEARGIAYRSWRLFVESDTTDPYFFEARGVPCSDYRKLMELKGGL